ncbi:unnamed protein product [Rotaria socialis]|nr:unnamed protein product [Rotaria socialis]CAF3414722.1 unnamed protein product [Rotaria socialis]
MQQDNTSSINGSNEIIIAKFNYNAQENHELSIVKNERLILLDDKCLWWKVKRVDSDENGYIPSNFARREKRSLLDKIISKRINKKPTITNGINLDRVQSLALIKFRYEAESEDEISLNKGIWVNVLQKKNDGWWLVQYEKQRGWFPSNYLIEKTNDGLNSLTLINQLKYHHSSSSSNGLSSSSSANSNIIDINHNHQQQQNRHNSHPSHMTNTADEYAFVIKASKFAHSDGKLDTCLTFNNQQQEKNNSWSALLQCDKTNSSCTSPSILSNEPLTIVDGLAALALKKYSNDSPYENEPWYYGSIRREEAEKLLKFYAMEKGEFLIRNSERKVGNYSLSIRSDNDVIRHFLIESTDDQTHFKIGKRSFKTLNDLIEHYKTHPVFDADPNNKLYLKTPLIINNSNHQF